MLDHHGPRASGLGTFFTPTSHPWQFPAFEVPPGVSVTSFYRCWTPPHRGLGCPRRGLPAPAPDRSVWPDRTVPPHRARPRPTQSVCRVDIPPMPARATARALLISSLSLSAKAKRFPRPPSPLHSGWVKRDHHNKDSGPRSRIRD
ncbi:hypothetical protein Bpfe_016316 [Biomphalaria pfeifferi]|uniref:Uncharacterized protein n=1 Tax=Biomphalaria pfeifferi TaxID=112525 RepID=A0AAD8BGL3_BIOPF|nr:hypothetical protein Bpfe_016316 [Biomphalaria pfeifferi]